MFTLTKPTEHGLGFSIDYEVALEKELTLQEFIDAVLATTCKWGHIKVVKIDCALYHCPEISYCCGKITRESDLQKEVYGYKIKSISANGNATWLRMDYIVTLEKGGD